MWQRVLLMCGSYVADAGRTLKSHVHCAVMALCCVLSKERNFEGGTPVLYDFKTNICNFTIFQQKKKVSLVHYGTVF